ncbi:MAG: hydantoinase/oxoprolinase N-terminal domain-containing protein, partial [Candidatus Rokuibacteriota bacterium]
MRRIGIDVGGTNTDAVLLEDARVVHAVKTPTTPDVTSGITAALRSLLDTWRAGRERPPGGGVTGGSGWDSP